MIPPILPTAHRISLFDSPLGHQTPDRFGGMEGDNNQRRHSEQSGYIPSQEYGQNVRTVPRSGASGRYRSTQQLSSMRSPTTIARSSTASAHQEIGDYGFVPGQQQQQQHYTPQLHDSSLQYQPDFAHDPQRQQQHYAAAAYPTNMVYNLQHQQQQPQSPYVAAHPYQPRQSTAVEVLSNQFGIPPFYHSGEPTSAPGPSSIPQQYVSTQFQPYQQSALPERVTLPSSYPSVVAEYPRPNIPEVLEQPETEVEDTRYDAEYNQYMDTLRETFQNTRDGRLIEAGQSLLRMTAWLLTSADRLGKPARVGGPLHIALNDRLGLLRDEPALHSERIRFWNEFNVCWLAVLQKQKDMTQEMLDTSQAPPSPQSILQEDFLGRMGTEIVHLSDSVDRHGLVDYQMGIWEEEILSGERHLVADITFVRKYD